MYGHNSRSSAMLFVVYLKGDSSMTTTSDTGNNSWGASSDRSELDNSRGNSSVGNTSGPLSSTAAPGRVGGMPGAGRGRVKDSRKSEGGAAAAAAGKKRGNVNMLFVSGMMGVKRHCLGTLRYDIIRYMICACHTYVCNFLCMLISCRNPRLC